MDKDGLVEDPGDGVGALNYLEQVEKVASSSDQGAQVAAIGDHLQTAMIKIIADAKTVAQANDLPSIAAPSAEIIALADQMKKGPTNSVPQLAQLLNAGTTLPPVATAEVSSAANAVTVNMKDFQFTPKVLTVKRGTTVLFVNLDGAKHTVTEDRGKFNSGDIAPGKSFTFRFDEVGSFPYHCEFHGDKGGVDMAGIILVQ